ncbi:MAG: outer membrane protein assembly factor BamD [Deltaproteobacteria bacterium]|nr:outer membrane protein assembly factor BamD [Deltaproteobacteria bacterium]
MKTLSTELAGIIIVNSPSLAKKLTILCSLLLALSSCSLFGGQEEEKSKSIVALPLHSEEELINNAFEAYSQGLYSVAKDDFTTLINGYPASYWTTLAQLKLADCHFMSGDYQLAIQEYERFINQHPSHEAVPYSRFQVGLCYVRQYRNGLKDQTSLHVAIEKFSEIVKLYSQSSYAVTARRFIVRSRELLAEYDLRVVEFYEKKELFDGAYHRLLRIVEDYPETPSAVIAREKIKNKYAEQISRNQITLGKPKTEKLQLKSPEIPVVIP